MNSRQIVRVLGSLHRISHELSGLAVEAEALIRQLDMMYREGTAVEDMRRESAVSKFGPASLRPSGENKPCPGVQSGTPLSPDM